MRARSQDICWMRQTHESCFVLPFLVWFPSSPLPFPALPSSIYAVKRFSSVSSVFFPAAGYFWRGGFSSLCEDSGRLFDHSFSSCAFLFKVEIISRTVIPLFMPGSVHSGSESWDDWSRTFPGKLRVSSFPDWFPHYAWTRALSAHSDFSSEM